MDRLKVPLVVDKCTADILSLAFYPLGAACWQAQAFPILLLI